MSDSAPKQEPPYGLRMPPELKARVKAAAESNNRSMNAEIVARLEASLHGETEGSLSSGMVELRYRLAPDGPERDSELEILRALAEAMNRVVGGKRTPSDD